jgi:hypothetical protein
VLGRREAPLRAAVERAPRGAGRRRTFPGSAAASALRLLVNAAGAAESAPFLRTDAALWRRMLDANLLGAAAVTRAVLPGMLEAGFGRVVNVASTAALKGYPYVAAYVAAKHGLLGLTRALALEVAGAASPSTPSAPASRTPRCWTRASPPSRARPGGTRRRPRGAGPPQPARPAGPAGGGRGRRAVPVPARGRRGERRGAARVRGRSVSPPPPDGAAAVDVETLLADAPAGHKRELRLWLRLLACANLIEGEVRRRLARCHSTPPAASTSWRSSIARGD